MANGGFKVFWRKTFALEAGRKQNGSFPSRGRKKRLIRIARAGGRDRSSALTAKQIKAAVAAFPEIDFTSTHGRAQRKIIDQLGKGGRIAAAVGVAGSGKNVLLKPLIRAWQDDGRVVHGVALAWRQSDDLVEAGIPARNTRAIASFLAAAKGGRLQLGPKSVVVIDEIGLVGTRQLNEILALQQVQGFQLVMLGDLKQMQSVEAGSVIALLRRGLGENKVPELTSSVRQKDEEERETVLMFRNGQTEEAVKRKDENGTLRIVPGGYREAVEYAAELWEERRKANHNRPEFSISVSAPTNAEAHDVSLAIRARRRILSEIKQDGINVKATDGEGVRTYDLALAEGDRVRLFRRVNATFLETNTVGNIGRNGSVLEVAAMRDDGLVLRSPAGKEGVVAWSSLKDERTGLVLLAYGDALTTNTAQGSTVTEHIHAIPAGSRLVSAFGAYTSGSRQREQSFIVTSEGAERAEIIARRPLGDRREIMRGDVLKNIVRNFSKQPVKETALDMLDRAANLRRGAIRSVQTSLHGMEARAAKEEEPITLGRRFAANRLSRALENWAPEIAGRLQRHTATLARMARSSAAVAEQMAEAIRRRSNMRQPLTEYWRQMGGTAKSETWAEGRKLRKGREPRR